MDACCTSSAWWGGRGARVLLSAVTRARSEVVVICGFAVDDLDLTRLRTPGSRALRDVLLTAAAGGVAPEPTRAVEVDVSAAPTEGALRCRGCRA